MFQRFLLLGACLIVALSGLAACSTAMSPQQQQAAELRRYCEANRDDVVRCLGFLGDR